MPSNKHNHKEIGVLDLQRLPYDESPEKETNFTLCKTQPGSNLKQNTLHQVQKISTVDEDSWPQEAPTTANILHVKPRPIEELAFGSETGVSSFTNCSNNNSDVNFHAIVKKAATKVKEKKENDDHSESSSKEENNPWLFDQLSSTLGPRGVSADLESLGEKSTRSRQRRRRKKSTGSLGSRGSRTSHRSHRSTKSQLSQMSEASRSVTKDLIRLEAQLAAIGKVTVEKTRSEISNKSDASSRSRYGRGGVASITVTAPPGKLGVILANKVDRMGTVVSDVRSSSPLAHKIFPGDRIVSIDGEDVSQMSVSEITAIMSRKANLTRSLGVISRRSNDGSVGSGPRSTISN